MNCKNFFRKPIQLTCAMTLALVCIASISAGVKSESLNLENSIIISSRWGQMEGGRGVPSSNSRAGGGSRNTCSTKIPFTALVPAYEENKAVQVFGKTIEERPTLLLYFPYSSDSSAVLAVYNEGEEKQTPFYDKSFEISGQQQGIIPVRLPVLQVNQTYKWSIELEVDCHSGPISIDGWVQRIPISSNLEDDLNSPETNSWQRFEIYNENNLWYSALAELANFRRNNPENQEAKDEWAKLVNEAEWKLDNKNIGGEQRLEELLESIFTAPILESIDPDSE